MWRILALVLAFFAIAWLEFKFVPGYSYLSAGSQLYLPILEHLQSPGYLSRDLLVTHANVTYTAFDEITLFLHRGFHLDFYRGMLAQQILGRLAGLLGLLLVARAAGLRSSLALAASAIVNLGTFLPGLDQWLIDPEPVPRAMAIGLIFLAAGCLAREKPLLSGLAGGIALIYDPVLAVPFWAAVILALCFDRRERRVLRAMMPILLVFALLLANLAQLQPGAPDPEPLFARLSTKLSLIQVFRLPSAWISHWPRGAVSLYIGQFVLGMAALTRLRDVLNRHCRWIFIVIPALCLLTIPFSAIFIDRVRWSSALRVDPPRMLVFLTALSWLALAVAGLRAVTRRRITEAAAWFALCAAFCGPGIFEKHASKPDASVVQLAAWAKTSTWGDSLFLFPGAGRAAYPSAFRGLSARGLWVDWQSGEHLNANSDLAYEWWSRWQDTMEGPPKGRHLQTMLALPIDYFVIKSDQRIVCVSYGVRRIIRPVFHNGEFRVFDASALKFAPGKLEIVRSPRS